jgi:adenosylmethionine-8-amino-7-oxononanoate aminotransferase
MITVAKGITSGYLPLGAVLCGAKVREVMWSGAAGVFRHGYTYSGHATACRVAMRNLDILERERLVERVARLEPVLAQAVGTLTGTPLVSNTRSAGLLAAVELDPEFREAVPGVADQAVSRLREEGFLLRALVGHSLQISPPFVIGEEEIEQLVSAIGRVLSEVSRTFPAMAART